MKNSEGEEVKYYPNLIEIKSQTYIQQIKHRYEGDQLVYWIYENSAKLDKTYFS